MNDRSERRRVLVVDDNVDSATTLAHVLAAAGYQVETCNDGITALDAAARFNPDACVLDICMPGMNGYELARRLRELCPDRRPVLATLTALADYDHLDQAAGAGFDLHFSKPADPAELIDQLNGCMVR